MIFDHFDSISRLIQFIFMMDQITYVIHQLHYNIYLVYNISTYYNERVQSYSQTTSDKDSNFVTIFDSISRLTSIRQISYVIHQQHYYIYLVYKSNWL